MVQKYPKSKNDKEATCGTIKAAILEGGDNLSRLLAYSIYDTNPVHMLSTLTENMTQNI